MPALPNVPQTIEVLLQGSDGGGATFQNAWYFTYSGTADQTSLNTLMGVVVAAWSADLAPHIANTYHLTGVVITDLNSKTGAKVAETVSVAGTLNGTPTTSGAAIVVSGKEPYRYRGGHRRVYLGGLLHEDLADANTLTAAFAAAMSAAVAAFVASIISAAPALLGALKDVIVHRFGPSPLAPVRMDGYKVSLKSVPLTTPITHPISSYATNPQVGSQRRRNQQTG